MGAERDYAGFEPLFAVGALIAASAPSGFSFTYTAANITLAAAVGFGAGLYSCRDRASQQVTRSAVMFLALSVGIFCGLNGRITDISGFERTLPKAVAGLCTYLKEAIDRIPFSNHDTNALIKALLTGDRNSLPLNIIQSFRESGASHILALSGLHLGIIYGIISKVMSIFGNTIWAKKVRSITTIVLCTLYTLATGAGSSITRALIFITLREIGKMSARSTDLKTVLNRSLLIQLAIRPTDITDIGFQLSYAAMAGIAYIHPHLKSIWTDNDGGHLLKLIWDAASLTISCQLTTGPLAYFHFKSFPAYFILTNLLALPLTSILIPVSILTLTLNSAGLCPEILTETCEKTASCLIFILETISAL